MISHYNKILTYVDDCSDIKFDLLRVQIQRVEKSRDNTGKWNFSALESGRPSSGASSAPSYACDMYNFGLILLWVSRQSCQKTCWNRPFICAVDPSWLQPEDAV